ncbi:fibronectin type III domain-containing protein [Aquihabitans sp. McL0605]|uniref:fibronectin type III domain-containing protein n=1 Tax=Aquihabitans sp. McL0605 TaxID=3415671 RepID=UPI003CEA1F7E
MSATKVVRRAVVVVGVGLIAALVPLTAGVATAQAAPAAAPDSSNTSPRLEQLAARSGVATSDAAEDRAAGLPTSGAGSLLHQPDGTFLANARLTTVDDATEAALTAAGARVTARSVPDHLVTLALDATEISAVASVSGVEWLEEVLTPQIHRTDRHQLAAALTQDGVTTSATCSSRVISEADTQLGAAAARTTYAVDGTGVTIGVLSDSYNNVGGAATDVSNGELPGTGNPCGRTTPVIVQSDKASGGTDEARGMAQAVHDVAPGATIMVATAFNGDVDFAQQIRNLATAGAKVIVDDVSYFNEPVYQDGIIAKAIADVTAAGVTYFSSAANSNTIIGGHEVASYEAPSYRPTTCPGTLTATYSVDCHDWDPGAGADAGDLITVANKGEVLVKLGYNEPQYGITTDLDLFLLDNSTNAVVASSRTNNPTTTKQAYELIDYTNSGGSTKTYRLVVARRSTTPTTPRFKVIMMTLSGVTSVQWNTSSGGDIVGPTSFGHNMMRGAGSIAAIRYDTTTAPETFSSRGPATYCWNPVVGTTAATALPSCVTDTIDVAATDGAANSFFGQQVSGVWRFYGTSQASPHAAAIAALQLQARPCRTPAEVLAAQRASGIAIGAYGVDAVGGGRVNASAAISGLATCQAVPDAPTTVTGTPGNGQVALAWTAPTYTGTSALTGYRVTPYIGATAQTPTTFNSTATTQTITGLTNGTAYTFTVAAINGSGTGADSSASSLVTPRTVPGVPTGVGATPGNGQVTLSWTAPSSGGSPITGYTVTPYIGATAQTTSDFDASATTRVIGSLTNGTTYTFRVRAYNVAGAGADSAATSAVTPITVPSTPTNVTGTPGNGQVTLAWTAPTSIGGSPLTGYTVTPYIGPTAQTPVPFGSTATTQTVTGLTNGTAYTFVVQGVNAAGSGNPSPASGALTPRTTPGAPTGVAGTGGNGTVALSWTAPASDGGSAITGYTVTPSIGATPQAPTTFNSAATTQTITGLTNGTAYTFTVAAVNAAGTGSASSASAAVTPVDVPGPPTAVSGTAGNAQVTLSWTAPTSTGGSSITAYRVTPYLGVTAQAPTTFASTATTQTVTGLVNGNAYTFTVQAVNAAGTGAASTASAAVIPRTVPGAPTSVTGTRGDGSVLLTWSAPGSNGGATVTAYTVTPYIGGVAQTPVVFDPVAPAPTISQTITGLTNGTAYTFKVAATNVAGTGVDSSASAAITPLAVPGAPTFVAGTPGSTTVSLSWTAPASDGGAAITGYTVTPSIGGSAQAPTTFNSAATTQTITGLTNGTAYTFKVQAVNAAGTGTASTASGAVTPRTVPGAPTSVTGTPGNTTVSLSWAAPASNGGAAITGYTITPYIGIVAQSPVAFLSTATTQTITGLANGTSYTFKVAATNAAGTGADSAPSLAVTPRALPGAPTGVTGTPGNTTVSLSWTAPASDGGSPITGYTVTPSIGGTAQAPISFGSTATTQTITGLTNGTAYTFKVAALNAAGTGSTSTASAAITPRTVPGTPTGVTGTAGNTTVSLSWTAPATDGGSPITGYTVTPSIGGTAQAPITFGSTATTQTITGLTNGTAYTFTVAAVNAAGTGSTSSASAPVTPRALPGAPTGVTGTAGNTTVALSWTAPASDGGSPITGYTVTPSIGGTAQAPISFGSTATTQTITGLTNGTAYTFKVAALNAAGTGSTSTASAAITPRTVPGAPTGVTGTAGNTTVSLSWTAPASDGGSPITGYTVTPYVGPAAQTPVTFSSTATTQTITGLTNGTAYTFKVAAANVAGTGVDSSTSAAITPLAVPGAPTFVTGTPGSTTVSLSWTAPASDGGSPITGYTVTPYIGIVAQSPVAFLSTATAQTITGLTNGTAYTFKVQAVNAAGTGTASTASAAITPRTVPGTPTAVTGTAGNTTVSLSWTAPATDGGSPITGYTVTPYIGIVAQTPVTFSSTATTQTITGLTNGTAYTFTVKAVNAAGTGTASTASAAVTPRTVPGAPTAVTGTAGNTTVSLSWTAPATDGGSPVTGYTVTPSIGATAQAPITFNAAATTQTITGLTNGTAYTFTVAATNGAGTGAGSAASPAITPQTPSAPFAPFASWGAMVDRFYLDMLGRAPTAPERSTAIAQLGAGTQTPGGLVASLRFDTDNVNNVDPVTRLYRAYFLRIPDKGGLVYWIAQRRKGRTLKYISDSFAQSSEFKTKYGSLTNRGYVERVYRNVLGRDGEVSGVDYWTSRLDKRTATRGQVMTGFSESHEYLTKQVSEVDVSVLYILLKGVAPTTVVFNDLVAALDAHTTTPTAIAQAIIDSPEYATKITS